MVARAFISERAKKEDSAWTEDTRYSSGFLLHTPEGKYCGFHFELVTDDKPAGYIRVLFFDEGVPFVEGFSEEPMDTGFTPYPVIYIGNGEYIRKKDNEDFYRSTKTAATYTYGEIEEAFEELKNSYSN